MMTVAKRFLVSLSATCLLCACGLSAEQTEVPPGEPVRVSIPAINVDAPVEDVGLTTAGAMDVPKNPVNVAWYSPGYRPGEAGNAVIAGHLDSKTSTAVFWKLREVRQGDTVDIRDADGAVRTFTVTDIRTLNAHEEAPIAELFGPNGRALLRLITCGGDWEAGSGYSERLIVTAELSSISANTTSR